MQESAKTPTIPEQSEAAAPLRRDFPIDMELSSSERLMRTALSEASWATRCSPSTLEVFAKEGVARHVQRGEVVIHRGDRCNYLPLILVGVVEASIKSADGKRFVASFLRQGELLDLLSFLDEGEAAYDFIAHTDGTLGLLRRPLVDRLMLADPALSRALTQLLCLRARRCLSARADVLLVTLRQRCARVLLDLARRHGVPHPDGLMLAIRLNQANFSDVVGWSRPKVNRELKRLESEGAIQIAYAQVVIRDMGRLRAVAE